MTLYQQVQRQPAGCNEPMDRVISWHLLEYKYGNSLIEHLVFYFLIRIYLWQVTTSSGWLFCMSSHRDSCLLLDFFVAMLVIYCKISFAEALAITKQLSEIGEAGLTATIYIYM